MNIFRAFPGRKILEKFDLLESFAESPYITLQVYFKMLKATLRAARGVFTNTLIGFHEQANSTGVLTICYDLFGNIYSSVIYNNAGGSLRTKSAEE